MHGRVRNIPPIDAWHQARAAERDHPEEVRYARAF